MVFDPFMIVMLALIAVLIFFMFRNGKKRQQAMLELQNNMQPGVEVMLQSGIYGTLENVDEEAGRVTIRSGSSSFVVHRNAVAQVITPADETPNDISAIAPDDDPEFGERITDSGLADEADIADDKPTDDEDNTPRA